MTRPAPTEIDVRNFRRAGESKRIHLDVPLVAELGNPVIAVPSGADVSIDLLMESVIEGVWITAEVTYPLVGECSRCLAPLSAERTAEFSELFCWEPPEAADPDDDPAPLVTGGMVDISDPVRDAIGLDLPLAPVCDEACLGLCAECGVRLADAGPDHHHDTIDPRWAALADLAATTAADPAATTAEAADSSE